MLTAVGVAAMPVGFPISEFAARFACFASVTAPAAMVAAIAVEPEPVTSLESVIVSLTLR